MVSWRDEHSGRLRITLPLIEESEVGDRLVVRADLTFEETTLIRADDDEAPLVTMECGSCRAALVEGMAASDLPDVVLVCTVCGSLNAMPD